MGHCKFFFCTYSVIWSPGSGSLPTLHSHTRPHLKVLGRFPPLPRNPQGWFDELYKVSDEHIIGKLFQCFATTPVVLISLVILLGEFLIVCYDFSHGFHSPLGG